MTAAPHIESPATAAKNSGMWLPMRSLWQREIVRFLRQPSRIAGLVAAPLLFWLFLGSGLGNSFQPAGGPAGSGYLAYFFPGTVVMVVLFTSILSNMSTIEDRRDGYLLSVLAAPIPRISIVGGKILGGTSQAMVPGVLFLLLAPVAGIPLNPVSALLALVVVFLISFSLTGLGFVIAWRMDSVQGFHAVLNLFLIPLWLLSGAVFPASGASGWIQQIMRFNPLSYEVEALRGVLQGPGASAGGVYSLPVSLGLSLAFCAAVLAAAMLWAGRPAPGHRS